MMARQRNDGVDESHGQNATGSGQAGSVTAAATLADALLSIINLVHSRSGRPTTAAGSSSLRLAQSAAGDASEWGRDRVRSAARTAPAPEDPVPTIASS